MAGETTPPTGDPNAQGTPGAAAANGTQPPPGGNGTQPQDGVRELSDGRVQILTPGTFKRIKNEAAERARRKLLDEQDKQARELGFESYADMLAAARNGGRSGFRGSSANGNRNAHRPQHAAAPDDDEGPGPRPQPPGNRGDRQAMTRYNRLLAQWEKDRAAYRERIAKAEAKSREYRRQLDAREAEMQLREVAVSVGAKDVDYCVRLLTRHLEGKDEEFLSKFDERGFFEQLRKDKPYLFGVTEQPATTGTTGADGAPPPAAQPGRTAAAAASAAQFDARKVKTEEYHERLRKLGLNPPTP